MKLKLIIISLLLSAGTSAAVPTPVPTPSPRGTPFEMGFYFARPARVFSWSILEGKGAWWQDTDSVFTEEHPYLTQEGFYRAHKVIQEEKPMIRVKLNRKGNAVMDEAVLGNIGRTVVMVWNGRIRNSFKMKPRFHPNDIVIYGNLSNREAQQITDMINYRPTPTPSPASTPSPAPTPKDSALSIF